LAEILEDRISAWRHLDKCADWVHCSLMKCSKDKRKVPEQGWNNLMHQYRLGSDRLKSTWMKRTKKLRWMPGSIVTSCAPVMDKASYASCSRGM